MNRLSWKDKIIYASGGLGVAMITVIHMLYLVYFFFPPSNAGLPYLIPQDAMFLSFTILGIIMAAGRLVDAITDPLIASWSDNTNSKLGKRIPFIRRSALGFGASYVLVFFVPMGEGISNTNVVWLIIWLSMAALFLTLYTVPHTALMVEIAQHPDDKIDLATLNSVLWFAGFLIVSFSGGLWDLLQSVFDLSRIEAVRISFAIIAAIGGFFCLIPGYGLKETPLETSSLQNQQADKKQPLLPAMKKVFKNRDFRVFLIANTLYTMATYIFETGLIYYITVLALYKASAQGPLTTVIGAITLLSYPFVNRFSKRIGKKKVLNVGFLLFALMFMAISILGIPFIPVWLAMGLVILFAPLPQSMFGVIPNAITADCAAWDFEKSGEDSAAMYFAVNGFIHKIGATLSTLLFTSFLLLGKDVGNDLGIRVAALVGGGLSMIGLLVMSRYDEGNILKYVNAANTNESPKADSLLLENDSLTVSS